jgi:F-type H+-transporting ATPase subunit c
MESVSPLPLAVSHMIDLGAIGSCLGIGIMASKVNLCPSARTRVMRPCPGSTTFKPESGHIG